MESTAPHDRNRLANLFTCFLSLLLWEVTTIYGATPIAVPSRVRIVELDQNYGESVLNVVVAFQRDLEFNEFPLGLAVDHDEDILGYTLYLVHTDEVVQTEEGVARVRVMNMTVSQLDSPSGSTKNYFTVQGLAYRMGDMFQVFAYNDAGESVNGSALCDVVDVMYPDALATNMTQTTDTNISASMVTQNISFIRGTAESELNDRVEGYRLYITNPNDANDTQLVEERTLYELGDSPKCVVQEITVSTRHFAAELGWQIWEANGKLACQSSQVYQDNMVHDSESCCLVAGDYVLSCNDDNRDGWHGASIQIGKYPHHYYTELLPVIDNRAHAPFGSYVGTFCRNYVQPETWPYHTLGQKNESFSVSSCVVREAVMTTTDMGYEASWQVIDAYGTVMCESFEHYYEDDTTHPPEDCCLGVGDYTLRCINAYTAEGDPGWIAADDWTTHDYGAHHDQPGRDNVRTGPSMDRVGGWHGGSLQIGPTEYYSSFCSNFTSGGLMEVPFHVGSEPGGHVMYPFEAIDVPYDTPYSMYEIRSYNEDLESDHLVQQMVMDIGIPSYVPEMNVSLDLDLEVGLVTLEVNFTRLDAALELPNSTGDIVGYALVVITEADAEQSDEDADTDFDADTHTHVIGSWTHTHTHGHGMHGHSAGTVVDNVTLEQLGDSEVGYLVASRISVADGDVRAELHTYSADGLSIVFVDIPVVDLARPIASATGAAISVDENLEASRVTQAVNFTRDTANELPGDARDVQGYGLYLVKTDGTRERVATVPLVFADALTQLVVTDLSVEQGDSFEVAAYTDGGYALNTSLAGAIVDVASPASIATGLSLGADTNLDDFVVDSVLSFTRMSSADESADSVTGYAAFIHVDGVSTRHADVAVTDHDSVGRGLTISLVDVQLRRSSETVYVLAYNDDGLSLTQSGHVDIASIDRAVPIAVATNLVATTDEDSTDSIITHHVVFDRDLEHDVRGYASDPVGYSLLHVLTDGSYTSLINLTVGELADAQGNFSIAGLVVAPGEMYAVQTYNNEGWSDSRSGYISIDDIGVPGAVPSGLSATTDTNLDIMLVTHDVTFTRDTSENEAGNETTGYALCIQSEWGAITQVVTMTLDELGGSPGGAPTTPFALVDQQVNPGDIYVVYAYNSAGRAHSGSADTLSVDALNRALPRSVATSLSQGTDTNINAEEIANTVSFVRGNELFETYPQIDGYNLYVTANDSSYLNLVASMTLAELGGEPGEAVSTPFTVSTAGVTRGDVFQVYSYISDDISASGSETLEIIDISPPYDRATNLAATQDTNLERGLLSVNLSFTHVPVDNNTVDFVGYKLYLDTVATNHTVMLADLDSALQGLIVLTEKDIGMSTNYVLHAFNVYEDYSIATEGSALAISDASLPRAVATDVTATLDLDVALNKVSYNVTFTRSALESAESYNQYVTILGYSLYRNSTTGVQTLIMSLDLSSLGGSEGAVVEHPFQLTNTTVEPGDTLTVRSYSVYGTAAPDNGSVPIAAADVATPIAVADLVQHTDDEHSAYGYVVHNVTFQRASSEQEAPAVLDAYTILGYRLYLLSGTTYTLLGDKTLIQLGGTSGGFPNSPFQVTDLQVVTGDRYVVRSYNLAEDSNMEAATDVIDAAVPHQAVSAVIHSTDTNPRHGLLTCEVVFTRAEDERESSYQVVTGYTLSIVSTGGHTTLSMNLSTTSLGGIPGTATNMPFVLTDVAIEAGDVIRIAAFNQFGTASNVTDTAIDDLSVPRVVATLLNTTYDSHPIHHAVTHEVFFQRNSSDTTDPVPVDGYTLFACPSNESYYSGCQSLINITVEALGTLTVASYNLTHKEVYFGGGVYRMVAYNDIGYSFDQSNPINVGDTSQPLATVLQPVVCTRDTNGLYRHVTFNVTFVRLPESVEDPPYSPEATVGYCLYLCDSAGVHVRQLYNATLSELGEAGETSTVITLDDDTDIKAGVLEDGYTLRVYAYNQDYISLNGNPVRIINDLMAPPGVVGNVTQSVDADIRGLRSVTATISFWRPADEGNVTYALTQHATETRSDYESYEEFERDLESQRAATTLGYILYTFDTSDDASINTDVTACPRHNCEAPELVEIMRMTLEELGGSPGSQVETPFVLMELPFNYSTRYTVRAYSMYFEGTQLSSNTSFVDMAWPHAVATNLSVTRDTDFRVRSITCNVTFVRDTAEKEFPGPPGNTVGYALYLGRYGTRDVSGFTLIDNMTLSELGGAPGGLVENGFQLYHQEVQESDDIMIIRSWNSHGSVEYDPVLEEPTPVLWERLFPAVSVADLAVPVAVARDIQYTIDTDITLHHVTSVVTFVRDSEDVEFPENGGSIERTEGYVLRHLDKHRNVKSTFVKTVSDGVTGLTTVLWDNHDIYTPLNSDPQYIISGDRVTLWEDYIELHVTGNGSATTLANRTLYEFGGQPGGRVLDGFRVYNLLIEDGDMYDVVAYNEYGLSLNSMYNLTHDYGTIEYTETVGINDTVTPVCWATDLVHTSDWNTERQEVTFWVYFRRGDHNQTHTAYTAEDAAAARVHRSMETPGNAEDVVGYRLYHISDGELDVLLDDLTLDQLGQNGQGATGLQNVTLEGYVQYPFTVTNLTIVDGDRLQVYAYNEYGNSAFVSEPILIVDRSLPSAQAGELTNTYDTNLNWTMVTQVISFTRAPDHQEQIWTTRHYSNSTYSYNSYNSSSVHNTDQQYLREVRGYNLYVADLRGNKIELVGNMTVEELGGSPGNFVEDGFELTDLYIEDPNQSQFIIFSWNSHGEDPVASWGIRVEDNAVPIAVVPSVSPGLDLNLLANELLMTVYFDRPSEYDEHPGTSEEVDGYKLFLQRDGGVPPCSEGSCREHEEEEFITVLTLDELDAMEEPYYLLQNVTITQHDHFVIYAYNEHGLSYNHSIRVNVGDEAVSVAVPINAYHEDDHNSDENVVTHRVKFTRGNASMEFPLHNSARTLNSCKCKQNWTASSVSGSDPSMCGDTIYYGCGMLSPCDGDEGGVYGQTWCAVEPGCSGYDEWDYCWPNHADVTSYGLYLYNNSRVLKESLMNYTLIELGANDTSGDLTTTGFIVEDLVVETGDYYVIKALNDDGKAHPEDHAWIPIIDFAKPLAVATDMYVTNDTNYLLHNVTHLVSFVRDTEEMENRSSAADTIGYGLRLVMPNGTVKQEIMYKTLEELGGRPGERVNFPFEVQDQLIEELSTPFNDQYDYYQIYSHSVDRRVFYRPECYYYQETDKSHPTPSTIEVDGSHHPDFTQCTMYHSCSTTHGCEKCSDKTVRIDGVLVADVCESSTANAVSANDTDGARAECATGSALHRTIDEAVPLVVVQNLSTTYDTNLLVNNVTHEVYWTRPSGDVQGYATDVMGYRLYLLHSHVFDSAHEVNVSTETPTWGDDGMLHSNGLEFVMERTIAEVGGSPGQRVDTGFVLDGTIIRAEDHYLVVAYSRDGECKTYETVFVDENAIPIAIARNMTVSTDVNLDINSLNVTVGITRAYTAIETADDPELSLADVTGYRLFLAQDIEYCRALTDRVTDDLCTLIYETPLDTLAPIKDRVYPTTVYRDPTQIITDYEYDTNTYYDMEYIANTTHLSPEVLSPTSHETITTESVVTLYHYQTQTHDAIAKTAFTMTSEQIELYDYFVVMSYNQDGNCADGIDFLIPDRATPIATATNIMQSKDMSNNGSAVTINVTFDRPPVSKEFPETHEDLIGYELWLQHLDGTMEIRMIRTIEELDPDGESGNHTNPGFVLEEFPFAVGDKFVIIAYNEHGTSLLPSVPSGVSGLARPVAIVTDLTPTLDMNPILNNITLRVNFTRPDSFQETRGGALDAVVGYELYLYDTITSTWSLLQKLTLAQIDANGGNNFVLENQIVTTGADFQIFSWNHNGTCLDGSEIVYVEDRAVPVDVVTDVYQSEDTQWNPYQVHHTYYFNRSVSESLGEETDVLGYRLYVCNPGGYRTRFALTDDLVNCRLDYDLTVEHLDLYGSKFEVHTTLDDYDNYQVRAYNEYGDSFVVAEDRIEDLAAPLGWYRDISASVFFRLPGQAGNDTDAISCGTADVELLAQSDLETALSSAAASYMSTDTGFNFQTDVNASITASTPAPTNSCSVNMTIEVRVNPGVDRGRDESVVGVIRQALAAFIDDADAAWATDTVDLGTSLPATVATNDHVATNMSQTLDGDLDYDDVSMWVQFNRAKDEGHNAQQVAGYLLYAGEANNRNNLLGNHTVEELGGAPGEPVEYPFILQNASLQINTQFYVVPFTKSDFLQNRFEIQTYFGNHYIRQIEDKAIPLAEAVNVTMSPDRNFESGYVTTDIFFQRPESETLAASMPFYVVGYKLYLAIDAETGLYDRGELLFTKPVNSFWGGAGYMVDYPFEPLSVNVHSPEMKAFVVVAYNDIGDARRGTAITIADRVRPYVTVANVSFTEDLDRRFGFVNLNVTFHRTADESTIKGYKLYLCERLTRIQLVGQKTLEEVGGQAGSLILNGFRLEGLDIRGRDRSLAVVTYNDDDSLESTFADFPDIGVPDLTAVNCSFVDDDPVDGMIGGTLHISHPVDDFMYGNATEYMIFLGSGGTSAASKVGDVLLTHAKYSSSSPVQSNHQFKGDGVASIPHGTLVKAQGVPVGAVESGGKYSDVQHILMFGRNEHGHSVVGTTCQFVDLTAAVPVHHATNVTLIEDLDTRQGWVSGVVEFGRAPNERDVEYYAVYLGYGGNASDSKMTHLGNVPKVVGWPDVGPSLLTLNVTSPVSVTGAVRLIVFSGNHDGESEQGTVGLFVDRHSGRPSAGVHAIDFLLDTSSSNNQLSGLLTVWKALDETDIQGYMVYLGHFDLATPEPHRYVASTVLPILTFNKTLDNVSYVVRDIPPTSFYEETHILVYTYNENGQSGVVLATDFVDTVGVAVNLGATADLQVQPGSLVALDVQAGPPWPASCKQAYVDKYVALDGHQGDGEYSTASRNGNMADPDTVFCNMLQAGGGWQLIANVPGKGSWLDVRSGNSTYTALSPSFSYEPDRYNAHTWDHDEAYYVPHTLTDFNEVLFMTGDQTAHCAFDLSPLQQMGADATQPITIISSRGVMIADGDVSHITTDLSGQVYVGCEGSFEQNQAQMLWGEGGSGLHVDFKNSHNGVGVFVR